MNKTPRPFIICPSLDLEGEPEICNEWKTNPCLDCPIINIVLREETRE